MTIAHPKIAPSDAEVIDALTVFAAEMKMSWAERQRRTHLDPADFARLTASGFLLTGAPQAQGGLWRDLRQSVRSYCQMVYAIASGDPSVGLVAAMHPAVLVNWLAPETAPEPFADIWRDQRSACFQTALEGSLWGTLTSEPGSGGDILKTRTRAETDDQGGVWLTGSKHFGSGAGISAYMITTALPDGAELPTVYILGMLGRPGDGSDGLTLTAPWDGHGMQATQSHAFRLERFPALPIAWPEAPLVAGPTSAQLAACLFTAVALAVVEHAMAIAREALAPRRADMRAYEQVGWTEAVNKAWTMRQVFNGMLAAVEADADGVIATSRGKTVAAELGEACLNQLTRVIGGAALSRSAPFGQWAQDVRALGYLRPPWPLAYDQLFSMAWDD